MSKMDGEKNGSGNERFKTDKIISVMLGFRKYWVVVDGFLMYT